MGKYFGTDGFRGEANVKLTCRLQARRSKFSEFPKDFGCNNPTQRPLSFGGKLIKV